MIKIIIKFFIIDLSKSYCFIQSRVFSSQKFRICFEFNVSIIHFFVYIISFFFTFFFFFFFFFFISLNCQYRLLILDIEQYHSYQRNYMSLFYQINFLFYLTLLIIVIFTDKQIHLKTNICFFFEKFSKKTFY